MIWHFYPLQEPQYLKIQFKISTHRCFSLFITFYVGGFVLLFAARSIVKLKDNCSLRLVHYFYEGNWAHHEACTLWYFFYSNLNSWFHSFLLIMENLAFLLLPSHFSSSCRWFLGISLHFISDSKEGFHYNSQFFQQFSHF